MEFSKDILDIKKKFDDAGKELFLVGGSVRDMKIGLTPKDFDFATNASVEEIQKILKGYRFELQGAHFGVTRVFTDSGDYEIACYREDVTFGRKPEVKLGVTMTDDARRRDFTINAIYYDITKDEIIDPVWGLHDLGNSLIKTPGSAETIFAQDKLRMLRAVRMRAKINGTYHEDVVAAIKADGKLVGLNAHGEMEAIHQNRIVEEFIKGIKNSYSVKMYLDDMIEFGFMEQVFKHKYSWGHTVESHCVEIVLARLLTIYSTLEHRELSDLAERLVRECLFSTDVAHGAIFLLRVQRMKPNMALTLERTRSRTKITKEHIDEFANLLEKVGDTNNIKNVRAFAKFKPTVNGEVLKAAGFSGEALGKEQMRLEEINFNILKNE